MEDEVAHVAAAAGEHGAAVLWSWCVCELSCPSLSLSLSLSLSFSLSLFQVLVFGNLFMFLSVSEELTDLLLTLMQDPQIEVCTSACDTHVTITHNAYDSHMIGM